jgi:hypothetical protein
MQQSNTALPRPHISVKSILKWAQGTGQQQQATNDATKPPPYNTKQSTIKKTANKTPLKNNVTIQLPDPFLDGGQGKITNTKERTLVPQHNNEGTPLPGIHATTPPLDNISVDGTCRS